MSAGGEAQPAQDRRDLEVDAIALATPELVLQLAVAGQHELVLRLRHRVVAQPLFEGGNLVAHVQKGLEGEPSLFAKGAAGVMEPVLRQIANRHSRRLDHQAGVRLVEAGQHLEQRRLAGAVRAAEADALAVVDLPVDGVEQHAIAERLGET